MSDERRPLGGRFTEWTNGTFEARTARPESDARVITAPLPKHATLLGVAPAPGPMSSATEPAPPASSPREVAPPSDDRADTKAPEVGRRQKKTVPIQEHAVFDKLLNALEYERPYVVEQKAETNGDPAAAHFVGPRLLATGVDTPPLEPRTKLSDSLVRELVAKPAEAPVPEASNDGALSARDVPTVVVTRSLRSTPADEPASGVPRPRRLGFIVVALSLGAVVIVLVALRKPKTPPPNEAHLAAQARAVTTTEVTAKIPPPPPEESAPPVVPTAAPPPVAATSAPRAVSPPQGREISPRPQRGPLAASAGVPRVASPPAPSAASVDPHAKQTFKVEE